MFTKTKGKKVKEQGFLRKRGMRVNMLLPQVGLREERTLFFWPQRGQKGNKWVIETSPITTRRFLGKPVHQSESRLIL